MFETPIVIVGNVVNDPVHRRVGDTAVFRFRVASNSRRRTAEGLWESGDTLYASVSCWDRLVAGTAASLTKGDPVIVVGQVHTEDYEDRDGNPRTSVEVRATAVGPDLARCTARIDKIKRRSDERVSSLGGAADASAEPVDDAMGRGPDGHVDDGMDGGMGAAGDVDDQPIDEATGDPRGLSLTA